MVFSAFQVFLVGFERVAIVLEDTPDRFQTHRKSTLGNGLRDMGDRVRCPLDDYPLVRLRVGLGFDCLNQLWLVLLQFLAAATGSTDATPLEGLA